MVIDIVSKKIKFTSGGYGFFSNCNEILRSTISTCVKNNCLFELDLSNCWSWYKDNQNDDVYEKFFKPNSKNFEIIQGNFLTVGQGDQYSNYKLINYDFVNPFVEKYFTLSDEVMFIVDELVVKYNIDFEKTIAVLYRGNNKINETNIPSYENVNTKLSEIKDNYPNHKIIIQSDEQEFCDFMLTHKNSFVFHESIKTNRSPSSHIIQVVPQGYKVYNAQIFLAIMFIISKCDVVLLNSGNVGMWSCLFRGNAKNVYQYLGSDISPIEWING